ncbi:MAG TPA: VWA domain-containing protein [Isosphaeraceae bacterium]|nr:VWA domain-containing protein [Isosphaeraceae bacterium]
MLGYLGLGNLSVTVGSRWWLVLIPLLLPPVVLLSFKSLSGLGKVRRAVAIALRAAVITLIVLALAQLQMVRRNDKMTTIFLLDRSESIPREWEKPMLDFVNAEVRERRQAGDMAGVIVFGKGSRVEVPPTEAPNDMLGIESPVDQTFTDLASAIKLALATFPEDSARRIVVLSDGNENRGNAMEQALSAKNLGVQIDVIPIEYRYDREVYVDKVSVPPDVKKGETIRISVVLRASEPTTGTLQIYQKADNYSAPLGGEKPERVELKRGVNVHEMKVTINQPNFYTFAAEFIPDKGSGDFRSINNRAESFTYARGSAQVLLIEGSPGEFSELVRALRQKNVEVVVKVAPTVTGAGNVGGDPDLPTDISQLQQYDAVILGDVPKDSFTDAQIQMFEQNTHDMGAGLIMLGGPNSFGAGGWMNTPVEKALPVDMQVKSLKVQGKSALALVMHATEIPEGNHWMKVIAQESIKTLSNYDYVGLLYWNGTESWLFTMREVGPNRASMLRAIDRMTPSDMPDFGPIVQKAAQGLMSVKDAMTRHMIIISDGDPAPPMGPVMKHLIDNKITVTTVLTAAHGNDFSSLNVMRNMAQKTKGRFYNVTNPKALPRIYSKEVRLIARPLIYEQRDKPWAPVLDHSSEPIVGIPRSLPGITGLVLTSPKEGELVDLPILSPLPTGQTNPVLAHWTYGLGRAVAFTSDASRRWTTSWPDWGSYSAFWSQVVRWALRPVDQRNLTINLRREEGRIKIVVEALDKDNQFLNFLDLHGRFVSPDQAESGGSFELSQTAPGHYEGTVDNADQKGNYFFTIGYTGADGKVGFASAGISVPYSDEYKELQSNPTTLETLADLSDGKVGKWAARKDGPVDVGATVENLDVFRRDPAMMPPSSFRDLWPDLLWLAAFLFLADIATRRIAPDFDRMRKAIAAQWAKLRGREVAPPVEYMEKLKGRKAEVDEQIERSRASTRFEPPPLPTPSGPIGEPLLDATSGAAPRPEPRRPSSPQGPSMVPGQPQGQGQPESYTNRLLRAKQKVWEEREKEKDK